MKYNSKPILEYIKNNNLSKKQFCKLCDISLNYLQNFLKEKDATKGRVQSIKRVAMLLKCSLHNLIYDFC